MSEALFLSDLYDALFPILRSLTGPGVTQTLAILGRHMPLRVETVASGTKVYDWTVPPSWHCRSAVLTGADGTILADLRTSTLAVVNYAASPAMNCAPTFEACMFRAGAGLVGISSCTAPLTAT